MPPTIRDFRGQGNPQRQEQAQVRQHALLALKAAKVESVHLTGDPKWDHFLQRIQANIDRLQEQLEGLRNSIPLIYKDEALRQAQLAYVELFGQWEALTSVIRMPKDIHDNYEQVVSEMQELSTDNTRS